MKNLFLTLLLGVASMIAFANFSPGESPPDNVNIVDVGHFVDAELFHSATFSFVAIEQPYENIVVSNHSMVVDQSSETIDVDQWDYGLITLNSESFYHYEGPKCFCDHALLTHRSLLSKQFPDLDTNWIKKDGTEVIPRTKLA